MALPVTDSVSALVQPGNSSLKDEFVSGLVQGGSWTFDGPRTLTWSLNVNELTGSYPGIPEPGPGGTWAARPDMAAAVASVFSRWAEVANIRFEHVGADSTQYYFESGADIAVTLTGDDLDGAVVGLANFPDPVMVESELYGPDTGLDRFNYPGPEGDVFLDNDEALFQYVRPGGTGYTVILHEVGHALGLKHPFDDGGNGKPSFADLGIEDMDRMRSTVMSYDIVERPSGAHGFASTPMPLDILAIQQIYGANLSFHAGDSGYALRNASLHTVWDAGGNDVLSAEGWSRADGALIDLREGGYSGLLHGARRMAIAYGVTIEDAVGSDGADRLVGNGADNLLAGGRGDDAILGGDGGDRLWGGKGGDRLFGQAGDDVLVYQADDLRLDGGDGTDRLRFMGARLDLGDAAEQLRGFEQIALAGHGPGLLVVEARAVLDLSPTSNVLEVLGGAGDTVELEGGWTDGGSVGDFHRYQLGAAVLLVDDDIAIA